MPAAKGSARTPLGPKVFLFEEWFLPVVSHSPSILFRIDTGDDNRVSKEEFTSEVIKETIERVRMGSEIKFEN